MIISIINNKGGTGKTTTCVNLSAALAASGYAVLLVDLDSQASASLSLGIERNDLAPSTAHILFDSIHIEKAIRPCAIPGLDLLTGQMELANTDLMLADLPGRERKLSECLNHVSSEYDFIFLDCPPSLSMLSINALVAADRYIVPVSPEYLALEGLIDLMNGIHRMKKGIGVEVELLGIVLALVNPSLKISREITKLIREQYGMQVFDTEIRRDVRLGEAPAYGKSIFEFAPKCRGADLYAMFASEVIERCGMDGKRVRPMAG